MESTRRVRKTELARNTHQVIRAVQRGETALVENHGEPEVAIIDILDYRLLRATMRFLGQRGAGTGPLWGKQSANPEAGGVTRKEIDALPDVQARYDLVIAKYLEGDISLGRAAGLLDMPRLELQTRFLRLDIPMENAPATESEARGDAEMAMRFLEARQ